MLEEPILPCPGFWFNVAGNERPIDLLDFALLKLFGHAASGFGVARKNDRSGHGSIEAMGDAEVDARWLGILLLDVGFDHRFERWDFRRRLRQKRRRFVDGDEMMVFEQNGKR